jgi:hypothetical protein
MEKHKYGFNIHDSYFFSTVPREIEGLYNMYSTNKLLLNGHRQFNYILLQELQFKKICDSGGIFNTDLCFVKRKIRNFQGKSAKKQKTKLITLFKKKKHNKTFTIHTFKTSQDNVYSDIICATEIIFKNQIIKTKQYGKLKVSYMIKLYEMGFWNNSNNSELCLVSKKYVIPFLQIFPQLILQFFLWARMNGIVDDVIMIVVKDYILVNI